MGINTNKQDLIFCLVSDTLYCPQYIIFFRIFTFSNLFFSLTTLPSVANLKLHCPFLRFHVMFIYSLEVQHPLIISSLPLPPYLHSFSSLLINYRIMLTSGIYHWILLAAGPNSRVSSGNGSTRNSTTVMGLTTAKTWHHKFTILAPIQWLSSDHIMTWSIRTVCSVGSSFTSHCQSCVQTNIRWVAIEELRISRQMWHNLKANQHILVRLPFESGRWRSGTHCTIHVLITSGYNQNSVT